MLGPFPMKNTSVPLGIRFPRSSVSTVDVRTTAASVREHRIISSCAASRYGMFVLAISAAVGFLFSDTAAAWPAKISARSLFWTSGLSARNLRPQVNVVAVVS